MSSRPVPAAPAPTAAEARLLRPPRGSSQCEVCRSWGDSALCADCLARFAAPRPRCRRCGLGLAADAPACSGCLQAPPPFERTVCLADYGFPWDGLIAELKFHDRTALAGAFAPALARAVTDAGGPAVDRVLPLPLSVERLAQRGYNQAWELARRTAALLALPAHSDVLSRPIATAVQHELDRAARQRNLRGAFMVEAAGRSAIQGLRVALVDDVMTTGATVREAAATLRRAGAAAVDVWVLARTPEG